MLSTSERGYHPSVPRPRARGDATAALRYPSPAARPPPRASTLFRIEHVERAFEAWTRWVIRMRWAVLGVVGLASTLLAAQLPDLRTDNSTESFLKAEDPALVLYDEFRDRFGSDVRIVVAVEPPRIFDADFLAWLKGIHRDLEDVPHAAEVTSLVNARSTRSEGDRLIVEDLLADWPESPEDLARLEERARANPLYRDFLLSREGRFTVISVKPDLYAGGDTDDLDAILAFPGDEPASDDAMERRYLSDAESHAFARGVEQVVERHASPLYPAHLAGTPLLADHLNAKMQRDIVVFTSLSILVVCALLLAIFRRVSGVLLPISVVFLALASTLGSMARIDIPLSVVTQIIIPFLLTVGICDAVHILSIFYQRVADGHECHAAIVHAMGHSGLAVVMTSATTAAGLLSFTSAALAPIAHLGVIAPIGVGWALLYTMTLLPALLAVIPLGAGSGAGARLRELDAILEGVGGLSHRRPWTVVAASAVVLGVSGFYAAQLRFSHNSLVWFPEDDSFRVASELLDEKLRGTTTLEVLVETGRENGLHDPTLLRRLDAMCEDAETVERDGLRAGNTLSLADVVKETHQALNGNDTAFRTIPDDRRLVAQELLLFENSGSDDLENFTDSLFSTARMTLVFPWADAIAYGPVLRALESRLEEIAGDVASVQLTGLTPLLARTFEAVVVSLGRSYVFAIAVITPMMMLLLGSVRRGLLSMIPNLAPVVFVLGLMGWLGLPLDIASLTIGSIVLGLAVDDTIHFMHKFRRYSEASGGDTGYAIRETLRTTGRAMLFTTLILASGFYVIGAAYMRNLSVFGVLTGTATLAALLADLWLAPALLTLWARRRAR